MYLCQELHELPYYRSVVVAADKANLSEARRVYLFDKMIAGIRRLQIDTLSVGFNWADAFKDENHMRLDDLENSPFAVVVGKCLSLDVGLALIKGMGVDEAKALGFYIEDPTDLGCLTALWEEAIRECSKPVVSAA
jgi:hypothetical protein